MPWFSQWALPAGLQRHIHLLARKKLVEYLDREDPMLDGQAVTFAEGVLWKLNYFVEKTGSSALGSAVNLKLQTGRISQTSMENFTKTCACPETDAHISLIVLGVMDHRTILSITV